MAQPLKVTCPSCSSKFHIPLHLVRGKVVSFRCKNCRGTIPVDGRAITSVTPQPMQAPNVPVPDGLDPRASLHGDPSMRLSISDGIVVNEGLPSVSGLQVDTPATFSQANPAPAQRPLGASRTPPAGSRHTPQAASVRTPAAGFGPSLPGSLPPTAISKSQAPDAHRPSTPPPSVRPARAKKIAAGLALLGAAALTLWSTSMRRPPRSVANAAPTTAADPANPPRKASDLPVTAAPEVVAPSTPPSGVTSEPVEIANPIEAPPVKRVPAARKPRAAKIASEPPSPVGPATDEVAPSQASAPQVAPAPKPASGAQETTNAPADEAEFNKEAARQALEAAGDRAWSACRTVDTPTGAARVAVTFAPAGNVISAVIDSGPFVGTPAGGCVASKFRSVRVPAFTGEQVTVHKSVAF